MGYMQEETGIGIRGRFIGLKHYDLNGGVDGDEARKTRVIWVSALDVQTVEHVAEGHTQVNLRGPLHIAVANPADDVVWAVRLTANPMAPRT